MGVRWRSREELRRRLIAAGFEPDQVGCALNDLEAVGLIDDERFAQEFARDRAVRRLDGDRLVRSSLLGKGLDRALSDGVMASLGDEAQRAAELAERKAARMGGVAADVAHRRLVSLLLRRGYPGEIAREAARRAIFATEDPCEAGPSAVD